MNDPTNSDARLASLEAKMQELEQRIPVSGVVSRSFWIRVLTVLGYNVIIALVLWIPAVIVIGMISAIAIPKFAETKDRAYMASMRSDLSNLVVAEERYFADSVVYGTTSELGDAGLWSPATGTTVTVTEVTADGWAATAMHDGTDKVCGVFVGQVTPPHSSLTEEGSPDCW
jgi:Tfp pilus assembly protein PilE